MDKQDFHSEHDYQAVPPKVQELLDWAYDYGYEDGETDIIVRRTRYYDEIADKLRGIAYDLENPQ